MSAPPAVRTVTGRLQDSLDTTGQAVVFGPWGAGKSTLLRGFAHRAEQRGERVLRLTAHRADAHLPYSALAQLLVQFRDSDLEAIPEQPRQVLQRLLPWHRADGVPPERAAVRLALAAVLGRLRGVLLVVDDLQWLDGASTEVLAHQLRTLPPDVLRTLAAERCALAPRAAWRLCDHHPTAIAVPAWDIDDIIPLLATRGLPTRWAPQIHRLSGGNPVLTHAVLTDLTDLPGDTARSDALVPLPFAVHLTTGWLADLSHAARHTLRLAALATRPTLALLRRAGGDVTDAHVADAQRAGVLAQTANGTVVFTADLLREAALTDTHHIARARLHQMLARAADDPVQAVRHQLLSRDGQDAEAAAQAEQAAAWARDSGERDLAAELLLLAAERTPTAGRPEKLRRLAGATTDAGASGRADLARRVHEAVIAARPGPAEQVAALLAMVDAGGQALEELDHVLSRAREAAHGDPALQASVELHEAIRANICGAGPRAAQQAAARAADLARQAGDRRVEAMALTMRARMERITAQPASTDTLATALALDVPAEHVGIANSPQYLAVRFAFFDDQLHEARERLIDLLPLAERSGDTEDLQEVLRSLAEVAARSGDAAKALTWSERALEVCSTAGLSPGPACYTAAVAQTAGGTFERAVHYARRGLTASREEHDAIFTSRNLLALATAYLVSGDSRTALDALRQVAECEAGQHVADLRMLRWKPELVEALTAAGELDAAERHLQHLRDNADARVLESGVGAAITRASALCAARRGDTDTAAGLFVRAAGHFADLGLVLEHGRTLIARGRIERARRRPAAARAAWQQAATVFDAAQACPWLYMCQDLLGRLERPARATAPGAAAGELTEAESRLAAIVAHGASNQEAAGQLFVSVKTVEAMLSRVYRKLDIRTRTQLAQALRG